jgi:ABC-type antimicrobial peptide transport system permease subunit
MNSSRPGEVMADVYVPFTVTGRAGYLIVRSHSNAEAITNAVRSRVYELDRDQPVTEVMSMSMLLNDFVYSRPRFNLVLFSIFAGLGLALAVIGVYGVISQAVAQQTQEIGVRIALGAGFRDIAGMVLRSGMKLIGAGIALGLAGSLLAARVLEQQVWNVSTLDPLSFVAVSLILVVVGLQACFWPARRAAKVDPMLALRCE